MIQTVEVTISSLQADLMIGLSWLDKDDIGVGSIQSKYDATDMQILTLQKHPKLVGIQPIKVNFRIIDDTAEGYKKEEPEQINEQTLVEEEKQLEEV